MFRKIKSKIENNENHVGFSRSYVEFMLSLLSCLTCSTILYSPPFVSNVLNYCLSVENYTISNPFPNRTLISYYSLPMTTVGLSERERESKINMSNNYIITWLSTEMTTNSSDELFFSSFSRHYLSSLRDTYNFVWCFSVFWYVKIEQNMSQCGKMLKCCLFVSFRLDLPFAWMTTRQRGEWSNYNELAAFDEVEKKKQQRARSRVK